MKIVFSILMIMVLAITTTVAAQAQELEDGFRMIDQKFHKPSEQEIEKLRDMVYQLDLEQSILDRYARRCEGFLINPYQPEHFVSIHAVDKKLKATRHLVRRTFTDDDDPRLLFAIAGPDGYADSRIHGPSFFPTSSDKLRLGDKIYFTNVEANGVEKDKVKFTGEDRNFDPFTSAFLPYSVFFNGEMSKLPISKIFLIDKLKPDAVAVTGDYFIAKTKLIDTTGRFAAVSLLGFRKGVPVADETWSLYEDKDKDKAKLHHRTLTKWERVKELRFPVHMEATQIIDGKISHSLEAAFSWRFDSDVPGRLFQVKDVKSKTALQW